MSDQAKRKRTGDESKQSLLTWVYSRGCGACKAVKYTASVDVLAQLKQAHLGGQHGWATGASGNSLATVSEGTGESDQASTRQKSEPQQEMPTPEAPKVIPAARAPLAVQSLLDGACMLLRASPSSADRDVFIFQQPLIKVVSNRMPANDKFDAEQQIVPWMKEAVKVMMEPAQEAKDVYQSEVCEEFGELQDRPLMSSIATGLKKVLPRSQQIAAQESATKYMEKVKKPDGSFCYVEKTSSPQPQDTATTYESSSKKQSRRWVMNILMFALMSGAWCVDNAPAWVPRVLAECKWGLKPEDIYQAALGGARLMHDRLRKRLPIDRLYLKVWSSKNYKYAILDVFGCVVLQNGKVTPESYKVFERQVAEQRMRSGDYFQEEAYRDSATSLEAMEQLFLERESEFQACFPGIRLPSELVVPVGVLYISQETRPFPTGVEIVEESDACLFYQGMLRAVSSNSVLGWDKERLEANIKQAREARSTTYPMVKWKEERNSSEVEHPFESKRRSEEVKCEPR